MSHDVVTAVGLAVSVAVVGMPHGGLDHLFGRAVLEPVVGRWWRVVFPALYLGVAAGVVAGWCLSPAVTVILFFLISAFHFGQADGLTGLIGMVEGGAVIWMPLLTRPDEVADILSWVIPDSRQDTIRTAVTLAQPCLWVVAVVFVGRLVRLFWLGVREQSQVKLLSVGRLVVFSGLFTLVPVLMSFGLYFCGWHSTREMLGLARRVDAVRPWRGLCKVIRLAAPRAALAVFATAAAAAWFGSTRTLTPVIVQAVFLGLSAVAIPHILLHAVAARWGSDPFSHCQEVPTCIRTATS